MAAAVAAAKALPYAIALYNNRHVIGEYAGKVLDFTGKVRTKRASVQLDQHAESANTVRARVRRAYAGGVDMAHNVATTVKSVISKVDRKAHIIDGVVIPAANAAASRHAARGGGRGRRTTPRAA